MAALVVGVAACAAYALGRRPVAGAAARTEASAPEGPAPAIGAGRDGGGDVAALRQEVALLRQELAGSQQRPPAAASAEAQTGRDGPQARESPAARAEAEAQRLARAAALESAFQGERRDSGWSTRTTAVVRDSLDGAKIPPTSVRSVECRSRTCRVEIADDGSADLAKSLPLLVHQAGEALPRSEATQEEGPSGATVVLYLSAQNG